jgi:hypothetical protein
MLHSDSVPREGIAAARPATRLDSPTAVVVLGLAALLAVAGDALLIDGITGIAFPIWTSLIALTLVALAWRAELAVSREAMAWLGVAIISSVGMAWRDADLLRGLNFIGTVGGLGLAAATINRPGSILFAPRLTDALRALIRFVRTAVPGIVPLLLSEAPERVDGRRFETRAVQVGRVALIVVPLLLIFGSLLRSADPIFASLTRIPAFDAERLVQHTVFIIVLCVAVSGWARAALLPKTVESTRADRGPLGALEITAALGTLDVLFAAFVITQLSWFFGGEKFLHDRTGLTAAQYARSGFFQMVWVVALVVPLLVASRALLAQGRALARRHTLLSLPLVALLGIMIVSAALRMKLYVHYYGLSTDRLYPLVFMLWLGFVLAWLSITVLRGWNRPFLAGVAASAFATLVGLNVSAPDRIVARVNIERVPLASDSLPVDVLYLATLGGEAIDLAVPATLRAPVSDARCRAAKRLLDRWGPASARAVDRESTAAAWRLWNGGEMSGMRAVDARAGQLYAVVSSDACARAFAKKNQR